MRILLVTAHWDPVVTPNVIRWKAVLAEWARAGHETYILSTRHPAKPAEERDGPLTVLRTGWATLFDRVRSLAPGILPRRGEPGTASGPSRMRLLLERAIDLTWRPLYWPDGAALWLRPGRRALHRLASRWQPDLVISVGAPFSAHLLGERARRLWPQAHWHMDIADPFALSSEFRVNNRTLWKGRNDRAERRLLRLADGISFTHEGAREVYVAYFPELADLLLAKGRVIPPLCTRGIVPAAPKAPAEPPAMGYFGSFYAGVREPGPLAVFFKALSCLPGAAGALPELHLAGQSPPTLHAGIRALRDAFPRSRDHGFLAPDEASRLMDGMDLLLHAGNTTAYHLPSKAADYLATGLPIVQFHSHTEDSFLAFAQGYPLLLALPLRPGGPEQGDLEAFLHWIREVRGKRVGADLLQRLLAPCLPEAVAAAYLSGLAQTSSRNKAANSR